MAQYSSSNYYLQQRDTSVMTGMNLVGKPHDFLYSPAPMYVHTIDGDGYTDIMYVFFYGFNGAQAGYCRCVQHEVFKTNHEDHWFTWADFAQHEADWEHVIVRVDHATQKPSWVYYARHGTADGEWVNPYAENSFRNGTHVLVYSALHSHGSYKDERGRNNKSGKYQPAASYAFPGYLRDLVNAVPDGDLSWSLEELVLADQKAEELDGKYPHVWLSWRSPSSLVMLKDQPWLKFQGPWAPVRHNAEHIHEPEPHLPGHLHERLHDAAKLAKFLTALPKKYQDGGRPKGPSQQSWWKGAPPIPGPKDASATAPEDASAG